MANPGVHLRSRHLQAAASSRSSSGVRFPDCRDESVAGQQNTNAETRQSRTSRSRSAAMSATSIRIVNTMLAHDALNVVNGATIAAAGTGQIRLWYANSV